MKILPRLLVPALAYLAIPFFASAQIAPSGIFRDQPTPTPQPSPTQTPAVATTPINENAPTPKPKRKPSAKMSEKPAEKAETKPANTPRKPPVADEDERPSGTGGATAAKLRQLEREWETSPRNTATIQKMVADDFIGVTGDGKIITKKAMLRESTDTKTDGSFSVGHMDVRLYGPNVAVVVGTAKQSTKDKAGKKSTTSYRFTDTWLERGGTWQCIAGQAIALPTSGDDAGIFSPSNFQTGSHLPRRRY